MLVLSDVGTRGGGGTLATFNRSIGPFEADRTDMQFLKALVILDPAATGRAGATQGAYRSPFPLPDGRVLASYDGTITDLSTQTPRYDLVAVDPERRHAHALAGFNGRRQVVGRGGARLQARAEAAASTTSRSWSSAAHVDPTDPTHGEVHYPDLPMLGTLLVANLRTGRFVDMYRPGNQLVIYQDLPPPDAASGMAGATGSQMVYQNRMELGRARSPPTAR